VRRGFWESERVFDESSSFESTAGRRGPLYVFGSIILGCFLSSHPGRERYLEAGILHKQSAPRGGREVFEDRKVGICSNSISPEAEALLPSACYPGAN